MRKVEKTKGRLPTEKKTLSYQKEGTASFPIDGLWRNFTKEIEQ